MMEVEARIGERGVALETTLLLHGVPRNVAMAFAEELFAIVREEGAVPALAGVHRGKAIVGLTLDELGAMLEESEVEKVNASNLGWILHGGKSGATTVATTMELASAAGIRVFATGGLGGVHFGYGTQWDISGDLGAFQRFPVGVVTSGAKSVLDVVATREALETLGIPVLGYQTSHFPAFYFRRSDATVDAVVDTVDTLATYLKFELNRTGRGVVVANPVPAEAEIAAADWSRWMAEAETRSAQAKGRDKTPALLGALHTVSGGQTLETNLALVRSNVRLAARLAAHPSF